MADKKQSSYDAKDIKVLEGLDAVRKRPGMYIGSTGSRGLHHLVYEVVDNSIDEAMAGFCDNVLIVLNKDGSVMVVDNGRGIPVKKIEKYNRPAVEIVLTKLHAGGKFGGEGYKVSGGLHGVGLSVVNALSEKLIVEVRRDGYIFKQEYKKGNPVTDLIKGGKTDAHGTVVTFYPDKEIFEDIDYKYEILAARFTDNTRVRFVLVYVSTDFLPHRLENTGGTSKVNSGKIRMAQDGVGSRRP